MAEHDEVLIIGGGVIGLTTAYFLAREGVRVAVVDSQGFGQEASWAGAGIIPGGAMPDAAHPLEKLRAYSAAAFPSLSAELRELTGINNDYVRCGGLEFGEGRGGASQLPAHAEWHGQDAARLDEAATLRLEPALAPGLGPAIHLPDMAQVRNPRHLKALAAACTARGVRLMPGRPVRDLVTSGRRVTEVRTPRGDLAAERFLIAAGAWSDLLLERLGCRPGIRPVRGQIVLLDPPAPLFDRILLCGSRYLVPRRGGRVLVGSTEEDAGFDTRTTAGAVADLIALALRFVPALAAAPVERCWAGLRPGSPDGLPFLGQAPGWDNVFVAAGHFRAGIQLSPGTALVMKECLLGQSPTIPLDAFRVDRKMSPGECGTLQDRA